MSQRVRQIRYREGDEPVPGYVLVRWLGEGGMGEVWSARSAGGVEVAMKILYGVQEKAGRKELRALQLVKRIRHPNLVPITAFWLKDEDGNILDDSDSLEVEAPSEEELRKSRDQLTKTMDIASLDTGVDQDVRKTPAKGAAQLIIAMGLGDSSLFALLEDYQQQGREGIPLDLLLRYMEEAAKALDFLNVKHGIQHCDVKPQNILLVGDSAQVCDFGLAKSLEDARRTTSNAVTVAYGAPEVMGKGEASATTDQYSLAITYVELRTGKLPFESDTLTAVIQAKTVGKLDLSRLTEPEQQVIARAAALEPQERYATTGEFVRELGSALEAARRPQQKPPEQQESPPAPGRPAGGSRSKLVAAGVVLILLVAVGLGAAFFLPDRPNLDPLRAQVMQAIVADDFQQAHQLLEQIQGEQRQELAQFVSDEWLKQAQLRSGRPLEAVAMIQALLEKYPNHEGALRFRRELVEQVLSSADDQLAAQQWTSEDLSQLHKDLEQLATAIAASSSRESQQLQALVQLSMLRAVARLDQQQWQNLDGPLADLQRKLDALDPSSRAIFSALQVMQLSTSGASGLLPVLADIARQPAALSELPAWERRQVNQIKNQMLSTLELAALNDSQREQVTAIWPEFELDLKLIQVEQLRRKANEALGNAEVEAAGRHFAAARALLQEAELAAQQEESRQRVALARSSIDVHDPNVPTDEALEAFTRAAELNSEDLPELAAAISQRAKQHPTLVLPAAEAMAGLMDVVSLETKTEVAPAYVSLLADIILHPQEQVLTLEQLEQHCQRATALGASSTVPLIGACLAECRLMPATVDLAGWRHAEDLARPALEQFAQEPNTAGADYLLYVRSLLAYRDPLRPDRLAAAQDLYQAITGASASGALEHPARRQMAVTILEEAAATLRSGTDQNIAESPYTAQEAERAYQYLSEARRLGVTSPQGERNFALAAAHRQPPQWEEAQRLAEEALAAEPNNNQLLLVSARAHASEEGEQDLSTAIKRYGQLLERLRESDSQMQIAPFALYERVVAPALQIAQPLTAQQGVPADVRQPLAKLLATQAELIQKESAVATAVMAAQAASAKQHPARFAYDAYARAYGLDPQPQYLIGQGEALIQRTDVEPTLVLEELHQLADRALQQSPLPDAHSLKGYALVLQSRGGADAQARADLLRRAIQHYDKVIPAAEQIRSNPGEQYGPRLVGRSTARLELAFHMRHADVEAHRRLLLQAAEDAALATQLKEYRQPDGWIAWGHAAEDLALYAEKRSGNKQAQADYYDLALSKFASAVAAASRLSQPRTAALMALGRCQVRQIEDGLVSSANLKTELQRAMDTLALALSEAGSRQEPEIHYWLSRAHYLLGDHTAAITAAGQAADRALVQDKFHWPDYQIYWLRLVQDGQAKQEIAEKFISVATSDLLGFSVSPGSLGAAAEAIVDAQRDVSSAFDVVDDYLDRLPSGTVEEEICRLYMLAARVRRLNQVDDAEIWKTFGPTAEADAQEAVAIARNYDASAQVYALEALGGFYKGKYDAAVSRAEQQRYGRLAAQQFREVLQVAPDVQISGRSRIALATINKLLMSYTSSPQERQQLKDEALQTLQPLRHVPTVKTLIDSFN